VLTPLEGEPIAELSMGAGPYACSATTYRNLRLWRRNLALRILARDLNRRPGDLKSVGCEIWKLMLCPDPRCDKGWIILTEPIVTTDPITGRRVALIWHLQCMQCTNNVASCCDGAGSQQPEPVPEV